MLKPINTRLGVCPIGKFVFSHEDALKQKNIIYSLLQKWKIQYIDIEEILPDGIVRDQQHVDTVVQHFKQHKIDSLFIPHCNFGTEGAVGMIAKQLNVPVLLWGPRDDAPLSDGSRHRDSLCGMFASSKVLYKLKVPFSYIENCRPDEEILKNGLTKFIRVAAVIKAIRNMKIAQIGVRVDFFWTTITNESELLEKFGIEVLPIDMSDFLRTVVKEVTNEKSKYKEELKSIKKWLDTSCIASDEGLINSLAMRDIIFKIAEEEKINAFSIKSFNSIAETLGEGIGLCDTLVQDRYPIAAESDIHGAISSVLLEAASNKKEASFFPEFTIRHPNNDNAVLLWHAVAPLSLKHPATRKIEILPPWILKDLPATSLQFRLKDGPLTVCRFDGDTNNYVLGFGEGQTIDGPNTRETYVWMEVDDWGTWERKLIEGPYIHHCSAIYDHCGDVLEEACKYIPYLKPQQFNNKII